MLSFEDFSGQSAHIAQLHADFANHTFVHAYLLCGPRGTGKKSVAFSLTFRNAERTLSDDDVNPVMQKILAACEKDCGAVLRA